jgi:Spy/CpxP family protein refolding chaperone
MKRGTAVLLILMLSSLFAFAQGPAPAGPKAAPPPVAPPFGMQLPGGFNPAAGMFDEWWKNPEITNELRLTDTQRKQLADASVQMRLALIDAGADGLKAITRLSALLDADQLDEAAYKQQLGNMSTAAANLIQSFGQAVLTQRRVLSADQYRKLQAWRQTQRAAKPRPAPAPAPR